LRQNSSGIIAPDVFLDLFAIIEVVGEGGMQTKRGKAMPTRRAITSEALVIALLVGWHH